MSQLLSEQKWSKRIRDDIAKVVDLSQRQNCQKDVVWSQSRLRR